MRRLLLVAGTAVTLLAVGCGGNGSSKSAGSDGSTSLNDGGSTPDDGAVTDDADSSAGEGGSGDGATCDPATSVGAQPPYATVTPVSNACTSTQIADFLSSCTTTGGNCSAFLSDTSNASCTTCLAPMVPPGLATNAGGLLLEQVGGGYALVGLNLPGCIALADPANGPGCAAALEPLVFCQFNACVLCVGKPDFDGCTVAADSAVCASYAAAAASSCASDLADGGVLEKACSDYTAVLNVICGTGP